MVEINSPEWLVMPTEKPKIYTRDLQAMAERLSRHNPNSFYSERAIIDYVIQHFEYVGDAMPNVTGGREQLIDWKQPHVALARVISHLPEYAQKLLIESGCSFKLYADKVALRKARGSNKKVAGFYDPVDNSVHWSVGENQVIVDFLHEAGHAIDCWKSNDYLSDTREFKLTGAVKAHLKVNSSQCAAVSHNIANLADLTAHFNRGNYKKYKFPREAVAELFAERTLLQWQHPNHPKKADAILAEKYPEIWPTMAEKYLPFMEKKADMLYARNHSKEEQSVAHRVTAVLHEGGLATELAAKRHRA